MRQTTGQTKLKLPTNEPPAGSQQWIINQLTQPRTGCHRNTQIRTCPTCHKHTLYGYAGDIAAWPATCDPINLNPQTQQAIHAVGRPLYILTKNTTGTHYQLHYATGPTPALQVLTNHKCGYPPPGHPILTPPPTTPEQPPF